MRRKVRFAVRGSRFAVSESRERRRFAKFGALILAWLLALPLFVQAHAPDTSYLRAVVSKHSLELRFTFDIATLHRIERLDTDNDGKVTRAEAEAATPDIAAFLKSAVTLELNGDKGDLGALQPMGWPIDAGESVEEKNYGQTLVHFTFKQETPKLIEDFYVLYEVFAQFGTAHRVVADIEQEEKHLEVVFTQFEPDYVYDTFWRPVAGEGSQALSTAFKAGLELTWPSFGLPLMFLALGSLFPRKLPAVAALAVLIWYVRDLFARMNDIAGFHPHPADFPVAAAMGGMVAAMMICALVVLPGALFLRRWGTQRWFIATAWLMLTLGGLDVTAMTFACRGPGARATSKSG